MKTFILGLLLASSFPALALSPQEIAAQREATNVRFIIAAEKSCDALRNFKSPQVPTTIHFTKDARGRVTTGRDSSGVEYVFEYPPDDSKRPSAMIRQGQRVAMGAPTPESIEQLSSLKARAILYAEVRRICQLPPDENRTELPLQDLIDCDMGEECGNSGGLGAYSSWSSSAFWFGEWMPSYQLPQFSPVLPDPVCIQTCDWGCDVVGRVVDIGCGVATGYIGVMFGPVSSIVVGGACAAGSLVGWMYCRQGICTNRCR